MDPAFVGNWGTEVGSSLDFGCQTGVKEVKVYGVDHAGCSSATVTCRYFCAIPDASIFAPARVPTYDPTRFPTISVENPFAISR